MKTEHVEPHRLPPDTAIPGLSATDVFRWLPLLTKLLAALNSGTGMFSTWSPKGKRWVVVLDHEPAGDL